MFKAIICDIQGVLVKNDKLNENLINFLIENKENYGILLLHTNLSKKSVQNLKKIFSGLLNSVDKIYTYDDVKYPKPDIKGFEQILKEWNLQPSEVIFIDDSVLNITSASSLGLETVHYGDFGEISELKNLLF